MNKLTSTLATLGVIAAMAASQEVTAQTKEKLTGNLAENKTEHVSRQQKSPVTPSTIKFEDVAANTEKIQQFCNQFGVTIPSGLEGYLYEGIKDLDKTAMDILTEELKKVPEEAKTPYILLILECFRNEFRKHGGLPIESEVLAKVDNTAAYARNASKSYKSICGKIVAKYNEETAQGDIRIENELRGFYQEYLAHKNDPTTKKEFIESLKIRKSTLDERPNYEYSDRMKIMFDAVGIKYENIISSR